MASMSGGMLLGQLRAHLQVLQSDPSQPLDGRLIESCTLALPQYLSRDDSISLIVPLSHLLPQLHADPTPAIEFLTRLLAPFSFPDIVAVGSIDFVSGLDVQALPYNRLLLAILQKASQSVTDAATIASSPEIVAALVRLWLCTPDAGVASEAGRVLCELLRIDQQTSIESYNNGLPGQGQGLMWKRVFHDKDIHNLMLSTCSLKSDESLTKNQRTLAQARLLDWLPRVAALDWITVTSSHHPEIDCQYMNGKTGGLLEFASTSMVDVKDDVLMHKCLVEFFGDLISTVHTKDGASSLQSSLSLDFLITRGLHARVLVYYLEPHTRDLDPLDVSFLSGSSANYLSAYAERYPEHFLGSLFKNQTLTLLGQVLDISPARWAHGESPKHDLHVLASLPRAALLPHAGGFTTWPSSPVSLLPSKLTNPDALNTLATLFRGPLPRVVTFPQDSPMVGHSDQHVQIEAQCARALYFLYLNYNPRLFIDLVSHAETVALTETALAAIRVIHAVITANWAESATMEEELPGWLPNPPTATPAVGVLAILAPPALENVLPYLLSSAKSFSSLVLGGRGDTESAAYKVTSRKFECLKALHKKLEEYSESDPDQGYQDILATLSKRLAEGPWKREVEVGGQIATMDL